MNLKEAYAILEIPSSTSPEEAKKKYRELTKKYHPDVNKELGAEDKFKKINEAYQVVSSGKSTDREEQTWQDPGFDPFSVINGMGAQSTIHSADPIFLQTSMSFKDSVLGLKKEMKFKRQVKCAECNGNGKFTISNGCDVCHGKGKIIGRQGNMVFVSTCSKCHGRVKTQDCIKCQSKGTLEAETSISVNIPGGVQTGNVLRLSGMGNFVTSFGPMEQYTDAHLHINVEQEVGLRLDGQNVVSETSISLLEALQGCTKSINTILGSKNIEIKPQSKNKDEIIVPKLGVNGLGSHKVILNVQYPNSINELIEFLSK